MIKPKVMLSLTATELSVVPNCGQFRLADFRQIASPFESTLVTSIQIRSIVALAFAVPANPRRATTLPVTAAKNLRVVLARRLLRML